MKKISLNLGLIALFCLPFLAFGQSSDFQTGYFVSLITGGLVILRNLLIFLISLAVVWFIWNVVKYAMSGEEDGKEKAKSQMIRGIVAIAVIVSIWGLVAILQGAFISGQNYNAGENYGNMIPGGYKPQGGIYQEGSPDFVGPLQP